MSQLCSLEVSQNNTPIHPNLQEIIDQHLVVFKDIPIGPSPKRDHDHVIQIVPRK